MRLLKRMLCVVLLGIFYMGPVQPLGAGGKSLLCGGISGASFVAWWTLGNKEEAVKEEIEKLETLIKDGLSDEELVELKQKTLDLESKLSWYRWGKRGSLLTAILSGIVGIKYGVDYLGKKKKSTISDPKTQPLELEGDDFHLQSRFFKKGTNIKIDENNNFKAEQDCYMVVITNKKPPKNTISHILTPESYRQLRNDYNVGNMGYPGYSLNEKRKSVDKFLKAYTWVNNNKGILKTFN